MVKHRLVVRYAVYGLGIAFLFLLLSFFTNKALQDFSNRERHRFSGGPFMLTETLLNGVAPNERIALLEKIRAKDENDFIVREVQLLDENGRVLFPPKEAGRTVALIGHGQEIRRLEKEPSQFLRFGFREHVGGGPPNGPPPHGGPPFLRIFAVQAVGLIGAVLLTVFVLIWTLRSKARLAETVIADLHAGNLKARFPVSRMDEIGHMMSSFNKMADEIEHLIESLRETEASRRNLLRELAHDLRTPIASMKTLIETVRENGGRLTEEKRHSLLQLALDEANYFEVLVDDLLFLGRVDEPGYRKDHSRFDLRALIDDEIGPLEQRYQGKKASLEVPDSLALTADPHLIRRMIRNALENAFSFARSRVIISAGTTDGEVWIRVADDGRGFDPRELESFGQKKFSRSVQTRVVHGEQRISVGLGSVIMRAIAEAHRGRLTVKNRTEDGRVLGAEVTIVLPRVSE